MKTVAGFIVKGASMSHRRVIFLSAIIVSLLVQTSTWAGALSKKLTMVVVPARYSVLQVSFDLLRKRDAVLVSYQGDATTADPLLHAWNGQEWVHVTSESFAQAGFLQVKPSQVVLVGDEALLPRTLIDGASWSPQVLNIPSIDTATLVNAFGKLFAFRRGDWAWFAARYNLDLSDLNAARRNSSWYDRPYTPEKRSGSSKFVGSDDTMISSQQEEIPPVSVGGDVDHLSEPVAADIPPAEVLAPDQP